MQNDIQRQILGAMLLVLRPIARALLKAGIGYREFAEISKTAFVDVAGKDYGLRGRPTNISRVAVMTGLTRKEVRRIRDKTEEGDEIGLVKLTPMSQVMHRWYTENEFLSENGKPLVLDFDSDGPSFSKLVKRFGGDIPPGAMRTELKRIGAIEEDDEGNLRAISRTVHPTRLHEKLIAAVVHAAYPLLSTVDHNVNPDRKDDTWAQMSTYSQAIRSQDLPRLRRISFDRLSELSESVDDLFMAYETQHDNAESECQKKTVAVGVFYFEERDKAMIDRW